MPPPLDQKTKFNGTSIVTLYIVLFYEPVFVPFNEPDCVSGRHN